MWENMSEYEMRKELLRDPAYSSWVSRMLNAQRLRYEALGFNEITRRVN